MYFSKGFLVFAKSNTLEDRLGETLYRKGLLNIDQLTGCISELTGKKKFGQIMLSKGIIDEYELNISIRYQISQILLSVFTQESIDLYLHEGVEHDFEIGLGSPNQEFIERCYSLGSMYRYYIARTPNLCRLSLNQSAARFSELCKPGSFSADIAMTVQRCAQVGLYLQESRLERETALSSLFDMYFQGVVSMRGLSAFELAPGRIELIQLRKKINNFNSIEALSQKLFREQGVRFPSEQVLRYCAFLPINGHDRSMLLYLSNDGQIHPESVVTMLYHVTALSKNMHNFFDAVDSLTRFLLQLCFDQLFPENFKKLKDACSFYP